MLKRNSNSTQHCNLLSKPPKTTSDNIPSRQHTNSQATFSEPFILHNKGRNTGHRVGLANDIIDELGPINQEGFEVEEGSCMSRNRTPILSPFLKNNNLS
ncbi:hypothetical protein CEXT_196491 [Caerostris extrusa]|uniref:Uncharacterized protein n=1 Tax=Caerostris extrusa TaxID=172846 RepID=A0AAV4MQU7_CAEEX|nr:hypothetical protein CEXT_196491 [Caerostris extrusa]